MYHLTCPIWVTARDWCGLFFVIFFQPHKFGKSLIWPVSTLRIPFFAGGPHCLLGQHQGQVWFFDSAEKTHPLIFAPHTLFSSGYVDATVLDSLPVNRGRKVQQVAVKQ